MALVERTYFHQKKLWRRRVPQDEAIILFGDASNLGEGDLDLQWKQIRVVRGIVEFRFDLGKKLITRFFPEPVMQKRLPALRTEQHRLGFYKEYTFELHERPDYFPLP